MQGQVIDEVFAILDDEESPNITNWLGTLGATGTTVQTAATTEQSARSGRNSANTTTLNNLKATLKTERSAAEAAADRLYRNTEQNAWNTYTNATLTARTSYIGSIKTSENTYKTAVDTAEATYRITTVTAYVGYQNTTRDLSALYSTAVTHAGDTSFNLASYFTTTGGNTACQAYEFITLRESNPHLATPYDPAQIQTPVFSDSINNSTTTQSISDGFRQYWDSSPKNDVFGSIHLDLERMSPVSHTTFQEQVDQILDSPTYVGNGVTNGLECSVNAPKEYWGESIYLYGISTETPGYQGIGTMTGTIKAAEAKNVKHWCKECGTDLSNVLVT